MDYASAMSYVVTGTGQHIYIHNPDRCFPPCPFHAVSDHHMKSWPTNWRADRGLTERICPHGIGHPDPDDIVLYWGDDEGIHGCDGCCHDPGHDRT